MQSLTSSIGRVSFPSGITREELQCIKNLTEENLKLKRILKSKDKESTQKSLDLEAVSCHRRARMFMACLRTHFSIGEKEDERPFVPSTTRSTERRGKVDSMTVCLIYLDSSSTRTCLQNKLSLTSEEHILSQSDSTITGGEIRFGSATEGEGELHQSCQRWASQSIDTDGKLTSR